LYEEIMTKAWNSKKGFFAQSYEDLDVLDSAVLIMPLVFFMTPSDPRFTGTLKWIMKSKHRGGLTSNVRFLLSEEDREYTDMDNAESGLSVRCQQS
jgi:GH15 family glucan-1,4-alpha-glucosidase